MDNAKNKKEIENVLAGTTMAPKMVLVTLGAEANVGALAASRPVWFPNEVFIVFIAMLGLEVLSAFVHY